MLRGETSISSIGDSRDEFARDCGSCFDAAESGECSALVRGTVWRRRRELAGARGGRRAILGAGIEGLGPQLDIGEKYGEVGLLKSPAKEERSDQHVPKDVTLCECVCAKFVGSI